MGQNSLGERVQIAQTILDQLGGPPFVRMTGARQLAALESGLRFRLPKNAIDGIVLVTITLTPADTYNVFAYGRTGILKAEHLDIYAENLPDVFRSMTGLETRMPRVHFAGGVL